MLARLLPNPVLSGFVLVIWMLLVDSIGAGAILVGVILGLVIPQLTQGFWPDRIHFRRPKVLLTLIPVVVWDIIAANAAVAWIVLTRRNRDLRPAFLIIPLEIREPHGAMALASIITLTPGTVSVQFSADRGTLFVHMLDCPDETEAVEDIRTRYERPLKELLEC
ncbi:Na(+)/H(+) antiporter subunit E1 [wastewater metagenome]|uniref:Na(+)/H(+) antiporter subunit E1 n=2 Tax=unclassified sequences TaxID=12908 RepID=A0A5B8R6Q8_9ZZZZ|nr:Na+/H+ antiporter subunit E [Arhodomonas sp. KWT]QEA04330.1 Na(+)/H(+) antiporter subunit E1 [uncultured organism]